MLFRDISKPHLWPTETLTLAREECREHINHRCIKPPAKHEGAQLLAAIDAELSKRPRFRR